MTRAMNAAASLRFLFAGTATGLALLLTGCSGSAALNESTVNVTHVSQMSFSDEVTRCPLPVVVEFYATWCAPCAKLAPLVDTLAGDFKDKVKVVKVNLDESPGLAQNYQVQGVPTLLLFKDGKLVDRLQGLPTEAELKAKLAALAAGK